MAFTFTALSFNCPSWCYLECHTIWIVPKKLRILAGVKIFRVGKRIFHGSFYFFDWFERELRRIVKWEESSCLNTLLPSVSKKSQDWGFRENYFCTNKLNVFDIITKKADTSWIGHMLLKRGTFLMIMWSEETNRPISCSIMSRT